MNESKNITGDEGTEITEGGRVLENLWEACSVCLSMSSLFYLA